MESRADLPRIACPTLILEGDGDWLTHRQQAELAASIAGAQHRMIPNAGHATNLDNPEAVNQAIVEFLAGMQ
jgi:pimeloyl-ACP methyl ester carboxylesterase